MSRSTFSVLFYVNRGKDDRHDGRSNIKMCRNAEQEEVGS